MSPLESGKDGEFASASAAAAAAAASSSSSSATNASSSGAGSGYSNHGQSSRGYHPQQAIATMGLGNGFVMVCTNERLLGKNSIN